MNILAEITEYHGKKLDPTELIVILDVNHKEKTLFVQRESGRFEIIPTGHYEIRSSFPCIHVGNQ
jgi:hypothetical protein